MLIQRAKEIGIILSYLWLLIAAYFFSWEPFTIFIFYFLEFVTILLFYCVVRVIDQAQRPKNYRKTQSVVYVLVGAFPLLLVQYFLIRSTANSINPSHLALNVENLFFTKGVFIAMSILIIQYVLLTINFKNNQERESVLKENLLFQAISLSSANILGVLTVLLFEVKQLMPVLIVMTLVRILLELYFTKKMKIV